MLILELVINDLEASKLAARGITRADVEQVLRNGPAVADNPEPRVLGSKLVVGATDSARFLTLILQPNDDHTTRWHLMTGWPSSARQVVAFHRRR